MQAMTPAGMPGTRMRRGPRAERERHLRAHEHERLPGRVACASRSRSARNTIGGMPTPPPISSARGRSGCGVKPLADRAEHAHRVARLARGERAAGPRPRPCRGSRSSRRAASARMIDSGRRIGMVGSQVRCAKLPGLWRAPRTCGACDAQHELLRRRRPSARDTRASSRKIVPRCARASRARARRAAA